MALTLLRGGLVHSPADPASRALLVDGETIAWVGSDPTGLPAPDRVIELSGALVTPAFVDAHVHATSTGLALEGLDLSSAESLGAALDAVERYARAAGGRPLLGHGWDESRWPEHRAPTRFELDRACYGGLAYLSRVDVHSAVVSSALLAAAPQLRTLAGYSDSGHLTTDAHHAARRLARDTLTPGQRRDAQRATRRHAAALGVGSMHELGGPDISSAADLAAFVELAASEPGPDVVPYWGEVGGLALARELGAVGAAGDVFADGSLGSHTASLSAPYADRPDTTGHAYYDAETVARHAVECTKAGLQAGFHAIGDAAVRTVVAGFAAAAEEVGAAAFVAGRHRIEHVEMVDAALAAELARLGVVASVQPMFDELWGGSEAMYAERLGADRALATNPFATLAGVGVTLAFGSDAPVTPLGPWAAVRAAVHHHVPEQRLSPLAAFTAHTAGGWRAAGRDGAGVLVPGAPATFAIWRCDMSTADGIASDVDGDASTPGRPPTPPLPDLSPGGPLPTCLRTVVRGVTVYETDGVD
jgi:predicted amidohydrolase YtcJ